MSTGSKVRVLATALTRTAIRPRIGAAMVSNMVASYRARDFCASMSGLEARTDSSSVDPGNPLRAYFDAHREGRGIWKWTQYFDAYHRHLQKFIGREVCVVEIGIYSGGSLGMWREYFGPRCHVHGIDIEESCRSYAGDGVTIHIGDQADRSFWARFREQVPRVDVVIDDGGHTPEQQIVTLEETLEHIRPGGVHICEDVHGHLNPYACYLHAIADQLNAFDPAATNRSVEIAARASRVQSSINSVHFYPFMTVIEKNDAPVTRLVAPKHGTEWQPFL